MPHRHTDRLFDSTRARSIRALLSVGVVGLLGCVDGVSAPTQLPDAFVPPVDAFVPPPLQDQGPDAYLGLPFGSPCTENRECESGYCVEALDGGRVCTRTCGECPPGYECAPIGNAGPDRTFVCLTDQPDICKPCETDRECDDPADLCLMIGRRTYCGEDCSADGVCPDGFACFEFERDGADGPQVVRQCAPADGEGCRPCRDEDDDGYGVGEDCLGPDCDDTDPDTHPGAPEVCDDKDNDCDSLPDESVNPPVEIACAQLGVCRATRPECDGGEWGCPYPDGYEEDVERSCDGLDNDCDGEPDDDFDLQTDPSNCGFCGTLCAVPNASAACVDGRCESGPCDEGWYDADGDRANGCEYLCALTRGGVEACDAIDNDCDGEVDEGLEAPEVCNGLDDDCDGRPDEGFDLLADPSNCGQCGVICDLPDATARCEAGGCRIDRCLGGYFDLDGQPANGCEYACQPTRGGVEVCDEIDNDCNGIIDDGIDLDTDLANCGGCGAVCEGPLNRAARCEGGECQIGACLDGFVDADGDGINGCEYACVPENGGVEACNDRDDDCDTQVDEGTRNACGGCGPVPAEACNGLDDDCDGRTDEDRVCGPYIAERCRLYIGWADEQRGPAGAARDWEVCPRAGDRDGNGDVRCTGTRRDGRFAKIQVSGDVNGDDQFAAAFLCDDPANPELARYVDQHCALFWGHSDEGRGLDDSPSWGPCPQASGGDNGTLRCTSSGFDRLFRSLTTVGDVGDDDDFAFAFICRDPENPSRAAGLQASVSIFVGWADNNSGPVDGSNTWGDCPNAPTDGAGGVRCTSTRGDGLFHRMRLGGDVNGDDQFGFALRAR